MRAGRWEKKQTVMPIHGKPTLRDLCRVHRVTMLDLARASRQHPLLVWDVLIGNPTTFQEADILLHAFNALRHTSYDLDDVHILLMEGRADGDTQANLTGSP